jgi:hypothetical protein
MGVPLDAAVLSLAGGAEKNISTPPAKKKNSPPAPFEEKKSLTGKP